MMMAVPPVTVGVPGFFVPVKVSGTGPALPISVVGAHLAVPLGMVHGVSLRRVLSRGIDRG